jgi:hypothetical protein
MLKIRILKAATKDVSGTSKAGKPYAMSFQEAYAFCLDPETGAEVEIPEKFEFVLPKDRTSGYARGDYTLSPASFYVDRDGRLALRPALVPVRPAVKA